MIQDRATYDGQLIESRIVYRTTPFSMTLNNP